MSQLCNNSTLMAQTYVVGVGDDNPAPGDGPISSQQLSAFLISRGPHWWLYENPPLFFVNSNAYGNIVKPREDDHGSTLFSAPENIVTSCALPQGVNETPATNSDDLYNSPRVLRFSFLQLHLHLFARRFPSHLCLQSHTVPQVLQGQPSSVPA